MEMIEEGDRFVVVLIGITAFTKTQMEIGS